MAKQSKPIKLAGRTRNSARGSKGRPRRSGTKKA